ncbi:TetR/AcrR family transcriptional regulator C-terminal domain-containing protein [Streptomyces radicis]|uniref:TetR/AcrR family transcriptional regulator C-terminal domain-containing protein n=1 Tax=Streptomyces radicis TaxID=1750517 RepID=UPI001E5F680A|nr:TetR/AcrR family transcriptional regulator C-terminal domain-containing protein [Streptomyces radicis]
MGRELLRLHTDERAWALRRLIHAEIGRFPELVEIERATGAARLTEALADRLARLMLAGRLPTGDPARAAERFLALLIGPIEALTLVGTRPLTPEAAERLARSAAQDLIVSDRRSALS